MQTQFQQIDTRLGQLKTAINMAKLEHDHKAEFRGIVQSLERLIQEVGQQPAESCTKATEPASMAGPVKASSPVLVVHAIDIWEMTEAVDGQIWLYNRDGNTSKKEFTMGVDTFELTMDKLNHTLHCQRKLDEVLTNAMRYGLAQHDIERHAITLWQNLMGQCDPLQIEPYTHAFHQFLREVRTAIDDHISLHVQGVPIFRPAKKAA